MNQVENRCFRMNFGAECWDYAGEFQTAPRVKKKTKSLPKTCVVPEQCSCSERSERAERSEHVWPQIVRNIWPTLAKNYPKLVNI